MLLETTNKKRRKMIEGLNKETIWSQLVMKEEAERLLKKLRE